MADAVEQKLVKWTELERAYKEGRTRVSPGTLRMYFYGSGAAAKLARLRETVEFEKMGAPRQVSAQSTSSLSLSLTCSLSLFSLQVLTEEQENFGLALLIEYALRRKPLSQE